MENWRKKLEAFRIKSGYSMSNFEFLIQGFVIEDNFIRKLSNNSSRFKQLNGYVLEPGVNL